MAFPPDTGAKTSGMTTGSEMPRTRRNEATASAASQRTSPKVMGRPSRAIVLSLSSGSQSARSRGSGEGSIEIPCKDIARCRGVPLRNVT